MRKQEFTLKMPEAESELFTAKCSRLGITRTSALRAFVRQYSKLPEADFWVVPVTQAIALGRVAKEVSRA